MLQYSLSQIVRQNLSLEHTVPSTYSTHIKVSGTFPFALGIMFPSGVNKKILTEDWIS
jgi:hypothetical protein